MPRRRWGLPALSAVFVLLLAGRFAAEGIANRLWAASLGAREPLAAIAELRVVLLGLALLIGGAWNLGNLYLLTRSIGSVQVPRRLGDIEIFEQVPRRYLLMAAGALGVALAIALGWTARNWWTARALWDAYTPVGTQEPVLGRDLGWYLFRLPWLVAMQRFALAQTGIVLGVVVAAYALVGALRVRERVVAVSDLARVHLGGLLVTFALALFWGYRLEPAEHLAGLTGVPADTVLTGVRIPVAHLLSALALVAGGAAALWTWGGRAAAVLVPWAVLGMASFVGHFVAPAAAAARAAPMPAVSEETRARHLALAYGLPVERAVDLVPPRRASIAGVPVWDAFAVAFTLDRTLPASPWSRFLDPHLVLLQGRPAWLAVREVDLDAARRTDARMTWDEVHGAAYGRTDGVALVDAVAVTGRGLPRYYGALDGAPDDGPRTLEVAGGGFWFSPAMTDFVLAPADGRLRGVPLGGWVRRLALAWALQSPQLLDRARSAETLVVADRAVSRRLARYAPFARFGAAYPAVARGRLVWMAAGYVWADGFPLVPAAEWRGRPVRYLRLGFVGTVDAVSGATAVYLAPDADPLARAWTQLTEPLVRPVEELPADLRAALRYPEELFRAQAALAAALLGPGVHATEPHQVVGGGYDGGPPAPRMRAALEDVRLRVILDGWMGAEGPRLDRLRLGDSAAPFATRPLAQRLARGAAALAAIPGPLKLAVGPDGVAAVQTYYAGPGAPGQPPWVAEVAVGWEGNAGHGPSAAAAAAAVRPLPPDRPARADLLPALRAWFDSLDRARSAGDWDAFGRAWAELRALLGDSLR